jgi:hypothetical protein
MSHPIKPFCKIPPLGKIKFCVGGNLAVSKNGNIRDRVGIASDERCLAEFTVQNVERPISKHPSSRNVLQELLLPGAGGTQRLPRTIGPAAALMHILMGVALTPREAERKGLVHVTVEGRAIDHAMKLARRL